MEKQLIVVKGIISAQVNKSGGVTVYTKREGNEVMESMQVIVRSVDPAFTLRLLPTSASTPTSSSANKENISLPSSSPSSTFTGQPIKVSSASSSSFSSQSTSRALVVHTTLDSSSLQSRFQAKQRKAVEVENKQGVVKGLFSSVSSFFW